METTPKPLKLFITSLYYYPYRQPQNLIPQTEAKQVVEEFVSFKMMKSSPREWAFLPSQSKSEIKCFPTQKSQNNEALPY
jgi:hypothetical protein